MSAREASDVLTAAESGRGMEQLALWRGDPLEPVACPRCSRVGLAVADRSARPYAEWYELRCDGCGLAANLHIPMAPPNYS
ncbi:MAG: hypothetical protein ACT4N2_12880 [Hyphomicrobium sp.]